MALTYGFYDSLSGDRKYNAEQFSSIFDGIIKDGIFASIGEKFQVTAKATPSMKVDVGTGRAWFNHTWTSNTAKVELDIDTAEILFTRIDAIVLEVNKTQGVRANSFKVIKGTPSSSPSAPTLINSGDVYQHLLATITVEANVTSITQAKITNYIGTDTTPYVTGLMQVYSADEITAQLQAEFTEWFESLEVILDGDVAANLTNEITIMPETIALYESMGWTDPGVTPPEP